MSLTASDEEEDTSATLAEQRKVANDDDDVMVLQYFSMSASANILVSGRLALITKTD